MTFASRLRTSFPALALVILVIAGLGAGYYFASASNKNSSQITWNPGHIKIKFSPQVGSGSLPASFTCSPSVSPVTLKASSSQPDLITITVSPSSFSNCGSTPDSVTVTAACTPAGIANGTCEGAEATGTIVVCGPSSYTCLQNSLQVEVEAGD